MQGNLLLRKKTLVPGLPCWSHPAKGLVPASADLTGEPHAGSGGATASANLGCYNVIQALDLSVQVMDVGEMRMVTADSMDSQGLRHCPLQPILCLEMTLRIACLGLTWRCS